jgi:hypothetical protein
MKLLRRPLLFFATSLLRTVLFIGIPLLGAIIYFGRADYLESTLKSAHAYDSFVPAVTESLASVDKSGQGIPFTDAGVRQIISNGLPPQVLEDSTDRVIDGVYGWLEGKTVEPEFKVDLTKNRDFIAENISLYAFNRLTKQPLCATNPGQVNPFTAKCLPSNFSLAQERASFGQAIDNIFPKTVFTAADLPKLSNGKSIASTYPHAPTYYRWLKLSPIFLALTVGMLSLAIVKLCRTTRLGYRLLGSVTLSTGVALMITPLLYLLAYPRINNSLHLQSANTGLNALSTTVLAALGSTFYLFLIKAALITVNLGLIIVLLERFTRDKQYGLIVQKAGLVSSNKSKRGKPIKILTADNVPLQSSNANTSTSSKRATLFDKFRKLTDKELS